MKKWRYFSLFIWLILGAFLLTKYWWISNFALIPESFWLRLQEMTGTKNIEDSADLVIFCMFFITLLIISLLTLPGFILWHQKFARPQQASWLSHPTIRIIYIGLITLLSFIAFSIVCALLKNIFFSYATQIKLGDYLNIPILITTSIAAIACGNSYRKISRQK